MTSHSQAGQDLWVNAMLEGRRDGFYVDIGCNHPTAINNTWAFEQMGWNGILVDVLSGCEVRKGKFFQRSGKLIQCHSQTRKLGIEAQRCAVDIMPIGDTTQCGATGK